MIGRDVITFVGRNTDSEVRFMDPGDYRNLINGRIGKSKASNVGAIESIPGTEPQVIPMPSTGENKIIGGVYDFEKSRQFIFVYNSLGRHSIFQVKDGLATLVMESSLFNFKAGYKLINIDVVEDEIYWTDNENEPYVVNINDALNYLYTGQESEVKVMKRGPVYPIYVEHKSATDFININNYVQFAYRYLYRNNKNSVLSPHSSFISTTNRVVAYIVSAEQIPPDVEKIQVFSRVGQESNWRFYDEFEPSGTQFEYTDSLQGFTLTNDESSKPYNYVPVVAQTQEVVKNRLVYANYRIDRELPDRSPLVTINFGFSSPETGLLSPERASWLPGAKYRFAVVFYDKNMRYYGVNLRDISEFTVPITTQDQSISTIKTRYGAIYGIFKRGSGDWSEYIPEWAYYCQVVRSRPTNISFFIEGQYTGILYGNPENKYAQNPPDQAKYLYINIAGLSSRGVGYSFSKGDRIKFRVPFANGSYEGNGRYYEREIKGTEGSYVYVDFIDLGDIPESNYDGGKVHPRDYFKIFRKKKTSDDELFYEASAVHKILNPGTVRRQIQSKLLPGLKGDAYLTANNSVYATKVESDRNNIIDTIKDNGNVPYNNTDGLPKFYQMNQYNNDFDNWVYNTGRPVPVLRLDSLVSRRKTGFIFSNARVEDTLINNLNQFDAQNRYDKIGDDRTEILKITLVGNVLLVNHKKHTSTVYIGEAFMKQSDGTDVLTKIEGFMEQDRKMDGDYGCIPETIATWQDQAWWYDPYKGEAVRYTVAGTKSISAGFYKMERLFREIGNDLTDTGIDLANVCGGFDPEYKEYLLHIRDFDDEGGKTYVFSEGFNRWMGEFELEDGSGNSPWMFYNTDNRLYSSIDDELYIHNKDVARCNRFYGSQKARKLITVCNTAPTSVKVWNNLWVHTPEFNTSEVHLGVDKPIIFRNQYGQETYAKLATIEKDENVYKTYIQFDINSVGFPTEFDAWINGDRMRSEVVEIEITSNLLTLNPLYLLTVFFKLSDYTQ
jgi:hypothetical protein